VSLRAVFLDVGETLVDETRLWSAWAEALEVPRLTLFALLGAAIARGEHHGTVFDHFEEERRARARIRMTAFQPLRREDFYPDALPCLAALRARGVRVGVVGNQPAAMARALSEARVPADVIGSSETWGAEKPSPAFFDRMVSESGCAPGKILSVGDRLDNDVLPALGRGLRAVLIRRGPWGILHARSADAARADAIVDSLDRVPELAEQLR
jgi:HAD superfamily hydrolase (TIGR01549 family)